MAGKIKFDSEQLKKLYAQGISTVEIARCLQGSPAGVRQALMRAGVELRSMSEAAESRTKKALGFVPTREWLLQAMAAFEGNALACAKHYGFNYQTFVDVLRRNGIPRLAPEDRRAAGAPRVEIPIEEAVVLSAQGVTYSELAKRYDVTYGVVMRRMQEARHRAPRDKMRKGAAGRTLTPAKWKLLQELKAERGDGCQICGEARHVDLAHIKANRHGGELEKQNALLLCPNHHRAFDRGTLTREEFEKVRVFVREAEKTFSFTNPSYKEW